VNVHCGLFTVILASWYLLFVVWWWWWWWWWLGGGERLWVGGLLGRYVFLLL